jgi:hypothetical protein
MAESTPWYLDNVDHLAEFRAQRPQAGEIWFDNSERPLLVAEDHTGWYLTTLDRTSQFRPSAVGTFGPMTRAQVVPADELDRLRTEASIAFGPGMYFEIQQVLDEALGTKEADGAGAGIVSDVALLAEHRDRYRKALELIGTDCETFTGPTCLDDPARSPDAEYTAYRWCDRCISRTALNTEAPSEGSR